MAWFPGIPLAIISVLALLFSSGWVRGICALLALARIGLVMLRLVALLRTH